MASSDPPRIHPLKLWLLQHGMPQLTLVEAMGVSPALVSRWLSGGRVMQREDRELAEDLTGGDVTAAAIERWQDARRAD